MKSTAYDGKLPQAHSHGKMTAMGNGDISDLMMIIKGVVNIFSLEWAIQPYILRK